MPRKKNTKISFRDIDPNLLSAILTPCSSKQHLDLWLRKFLGVQLANNTVSQFSNTNALDLAWLVYSYAVAPPGTYTETLKILTVGGRGSQKTLWCAAVNTAILMHDRRSFLHYAASRGQASAGFSYINGFLTNQYLKIFLAAKPTKERLILEIPHYQNLDDVQLCTADVYPISTYTVESRHVSLISVDELSSLGSDKLTSFKYLSGIPIPSNEGKPPIWLNISSRKQTGSLIEEQIAKAQETGLKVFYWTALELCKRCPPSRHGEEKATYYGSPYFMKIIQPQEYENLEDKDKVKYFQADGFKGCLECPIAHSCLSQLAHQTCDLPMLSSVDQLIFNMKQEPNLWTAQRMSLESTREGAIYSAFNTERHIKTEVEILKLLEAPTNETDLLAYIKKQKFLKACGIDHSGGSAEGAITLAIIDEKGRIFWIDSYSKEGLDTPTMIVKLREFDDKYKLDILFPDPSAADKNVELERAGFLVQSDLRKSVISGIDHTRNYLMNYQGATAMYFLKGKTDKMASDFMKYRFKSKVENIFSDEPAEENSHYPDSARYLVQNIIERNYKGVKVSIEDQKPDTKIENMSDVRRALSNSFKKHLSNLGVETEAPDEPVDGGSGVKWII
jgi:hypothetical protein